MIAMRRMLSTMLAVTRRWRSLLSGCADFCWPGCVAHAGAAGAGGGDARCGRDAFTMPDGAALPYRAWLPEAGRRR